MTRPLEHIRSILKTIADRHRLDHRLVAGLVMVESGGNPSAVRFQADYPHLFRPGEVKPACCSLATETVLQKTSIGLMQVMGATARELGFSGWLTELCCPELGLEFGCRLLARLAAMYGPGDQAVSAYNQGTPRRDAAGRFLNQDYVDRVAASGKEEVNRQAAPREVQASQGNNNRILKFQGPQDKGAGYRFSSLSRSRLKTCDARLCALFEEVLKECDVSILEGHRSKERQARLVAQGRSQTLNSKHLAKPSRAVDAAPYPIDWKDIPGFVRFGALVKETAARLGLKITWGGDWRSLKDYVHFELTD